MNGQPEMVSLNNQPEATPMYIPGVYSTRWCGRLGWQRAESNNGSPFEEGSGTHLGGPCLDSTESFSHRIGLYGLC